MPPAFARAGLHGRLTGHHRFLLQLYLDQYDAAGEGIGKIDEEVSAAIEKMDAEVPAGQACFRSLIGLLFTIPGVSALSATTILSEIGTDMSRFPTAGHLLAPAFARTSLGRPVPEPERKRG